MIERAIGRHVSRRLAAATGMALISMGALVGCSDGGDDGSNNAPVNADDLVSAMPAASGEIETLRWNLSAEPDTIDPANAATYPSGTVVRTLCDSLTTMNPDFSLSPSLGTSEVVSPKQVVFTLRDDAKFWNGQPVTAEDVAYSLERTMNPNYILSFIFINVESIEATGPFEVTVNFKQPDELFLNEMQNVAIVEKAFAEKAGDALGTAEGGLMCSGPYKLENWAAGDGMTVTRNEDYWNSDLRPLPGTIEFSFISEATALAQALNAGEIDGAYEIPPTAIPSLQDSEVGRVTFGPSSQGLNINIVTPGGPMADPNLRQAFQHLVDREAVADVVYQGAATPAYTTIPPAMWSEEGQDLFQSAYDEAEADRQYDLEAAKALVEDSDYDGTPIVAAVEAGDEPTSRVAQLIQQQAKEVGLTVEIETLQPLVFAQAGYDASKRQGIDLMIQENFNGSADPLEPLGFSYLPGQPYNYTEFDDPEVTQLLTEARKTFDATERAQMVVDALEIIEADSATIPVVFMNTTTFLNNEYTGAVTSFAYWSSPALAYIGTE